MLGIGFCLTFIWLIYDKRKREFVWFGRGREKVECRGVLGKLNEKGRCVGKK